MYKVLIAGGGISGLTIGFEFLDRGLTPDQILIVESGSIPGGNIRTEQRDDLIIEAGPNGFLDNSPPTLDLVRRLDMNSRLLQSDETAAIRFIYSRGKLRKVPKGPVGMLMSGLLPLPGTLRLFMEPLITRGGHPEETVFDFAARRIGKAAAGTLVDAMVSGVFAADSRQLELASAFPKMAAMEAEYGGLVKAMIGIKKKRRQAPEGGGAFKGGGPSGPAGRLTSFKNGFQELPAKLAEKLKESLKVNLSVKQVKNVDDGFEVALSDGTSVKAGSVVLACPAKTSAGIVQNMNTQLADELSSISTSSLGVVATTYKKQDLAAPPRGFGFLVPRGAGPRILGCLWTSSIWRGRAPDDTVLLRTMIGGAKDPEAIKLSDDELLKIVSDDLKQTMGLNADHSSHMIYRHKGGIAQYCPGHSERLTRINALLTQTPRLFVSGSSYGGISVNNCIAEASDIAVKALRSLC